MNEKIKELKQQATIIVGAESGFAFDREVLDEQKFAELIVRECAEFVEHEIEVAGYKAKRILKHFGVEE